MKEKILKLIDVYIQDDTIISAKPEKSPPYFPTVTDYDINYFRQYEDGVFILNTKKIKKFIPEITAYHKGECIDRNNFSSIRHLYGFNSNFKVKFPEYKEESFVYYDMLFSFENKPAIEIYNKSGKIVEITLLGKRVKRMGEEGTIVICAPDWNGKEPEYFIEFKENDREQLLGLPFQIWDDDKSRFTDDRSDILFDLTNEEKGYLNIGDDFILRNI